MNTAIIGRALRKAAPTIVTIATALGVCATAYFSAKAGVEGKMAIEDEEKKQGRELDTIEKIKAVAPKVVPAAVALTATLSSVMVGRIVDKRLRTEALAIYATTYKTLEQKYKNYQEATKRICGDDVHVKILQEANIKEAEETYVHGECFGVIVDGPFNMDEELRTFFDSYSGQYFKASIGQVVRAELHVNRNFALAGEVCVKDWYDFLGIEPPPNAEDLWWAYGDDVMFIDFVHTKAETDDGFECGIIEFAWDPIPYSQIDW